MRKIEIKNGFEVLVDNEDFKLVSSLDLILRKATQKKIVYYYAYISSKGTPFKYPKALHHFLFGKPPKGKTFWFKDGNRLNCQKNNVEILTISQKSHITHKNPDKIKKKFRGVFQNYLARVKIDNKIIVVGSYKTEREAAKAYNEKVKQLYGEFAVLNKI
jgi:hypothetical protein